MKKTSVRCTGLDAKGVQCGRMVRVKNLFHGQPVLCPFHSPTPAPQAFQASEDPGQILRTLLKDRDPAIRLRAVEAWERYEERQRERQQAEPKDGLDFNQLLPEERAELQTAIAMVKSVKTRLYRRLHGDPPEPELLPEPVTPTLAPEMLPPQPPPLPVAPSVDDAPATLPKELWHKVGLYETRAGITHAAGDEYAADVLTGKIPFEEAVERLQRSLHQTNTFIASLRNED